MTLLLISCCVWLAVSIWRHRHEHLFDRRGDDLYTIAEQQRKLNALRPRKDNR